MLWTIIEKEGGKVLYFKGDDEVLENELAITELLGEDMENPHFDLETRTFYDKK
jgi:hypothetical protein